MQYELDIPIEVKVGTIGKISLSIPWTGLYTQPVTVILEVSKKPHHENKAYATSTLLFGGSVLLLPERIRIISNKFGTGCFRHILTQLFWSRAKDS